MNAWCRLAFLVYRGKSCALNRTAPRRKSCAFEQDSSARQKPIGLDGTG